MPASPLLRLCRLAEGGMGFVDLVLRQGPVRRFYVVKRLHPQLRADDGLRRMFLDEARLAGLIRHPHVVAVHEAAEDEDGPFLVMDYVEGISVATLIQEATPQGAPLPLALCLGIAAQVARGLHSAHEITATDGTPLALVHRDVSPQNVLIGYDGLARLTDFGIAKAFGNLTQTSTGLLKGNIGYMAPELLRFQPADRRSDLYALGVVLHEMLCRRRAYRGEDAAEVARRILAEEVPDIGDMRADVPSALSELMFELLARDPAARPVDAREVATRIEAILVVVQAELGQFDAVAFMTEHFGARHALRAQQIAEALTQVPARPRRLRAVLAIVAAIAIVGAVVGGVKVAARLRSQVTPSVAATPVGRGASVWAGSWHTCATRDNQLYCWGKNNMGQLGDGTTSDRSVRQTPTRAAPVVGVSGGQFHTCALDRNGSVLCWGRNAEGQLGRGTDVEGSSHPLPVPGINDALAVAAGDWHTCVLRRSGRVACWGRNDAGQLGTGNAGEPRRDPHDVAGVFDVREVTAGRHTTCARLGSGAVVCWGTQVTAEIGDDLPFGVAGPTRILPLEDAIQITAGGNFACALRAQGTVACWGSNDFGQLGAGEEIKGRTAAEAVPGLVNARAVAAGITFACALLTDRSVRCWGRGDWGNLGVGVQSSQLKQPIPVTVADIDDAVALAVGHCHACVRRTGGGISCWGLNESGQVGDGGSADARSRPVSAAGFP